MWYRDALNIGASEGVIQCTYACIYDEDGKALFALYRGRFDELAKKFGGYAKQSTDTKIIVDTGTFSQEGIVAWEMDVRQKDGSYADTGYIQFDLPLVIAEKHSSERLVPVRLDYNAIAYIKRTLKSAKPVKMAEVYKETEWIVYESGGSKKPNYAEKITMSDLSQRYMKLDLGGGYYIFRNNGIDYHVEIIDDYNPRWLKLSQRLNDTDIFYVKPAAFDWQPINMENLNQSDLEWKKRIEISKEKLNRAKALLIAAGATAII